MEIELHPDASDELEALPTRELQALAQAFEKLEALGDQLGFPHSSNVVGADRLRELRPRAGRSRWRAFYRRIGAVMFVGAIGPEAAVDARGFRAAVTQAEGRLAEKEQAR